MLSLKKIGICILVLVILIAIIIVVIVKLNYGEEISFDPPSDSEEKVEFSNRLEIVSGINEFNYVETCINKFYTYYNDMYNFEDGNYIMDDDAKVYKEQLSNNISKKLYSMLDKRYIKEYSLNENNIVDHIASDKKINIDVIRMNKYQQDLTKAIYFVEVNTIIDNNINPEMIIVKVDMINKTFELLLDDYVKKYYSNVKVEDNIDSELLETIDNRKYNLYENKNITEEQYITNLFLRLKNDFLNNEINVYKLLNKEYRENRFLSADEFKEFVKNNYKQFILMELKSYLKNEYQDYTEYICLDTKNQYYVFRVYEDLSYEIILDLYTTKLDKIEEKYMVLSEDEKALNNINNIIDAIEKGNYNYVYSKLNNSFKESNFKNIDVLKMYFKNIFDGEYEIDILNSKKINNVYMYNVKIASLDTKDSIEKEIFIDIKEDLEFEISFGID